MAGKHPKWAWRLVLVSILAWWGGPGNAGWPGDMNCDGDINFDDISGFVCAMAGEQTYLSVYPDCEWLNADCNGDGTVDFDDINPFVGILVNGLPYLGEVWHNGCLKQGGGGGPWCPGDDAIVLTVQGNNLHALHMNIEYNCCLDDIVVTFTAQGSLLRFDEEEVLTNPCYCVCCYEAGTTVVGLAPGTYTVQYCWYDYGFGPRCDEQQITIP